MTIVISLIIFGVGIYFFIRVNKKLKDLNEGLVAKEARDEIDSVITEFNRAAARNIELLEDRIELLQQTMQKANSKVDQLNNRIERANKPIVIEKLIEKQERSHDQDAVELYKQNSRDRKNYQDKAPPMRHKKDSRETELSKNSRSSKKKKENLFTEPQPIKQKQVPHDEIIAPNPETIKKTSPKPEPIRQEVRETPDLTQELSRSAKLKSMISQGVSRDELLDMGFMENEINLLSFLSKKE